MSARKGPSDSNVNQGIVDFLMGRFSLNGQLVSCQVFFVHSYPWLEFARPVLISRPCYQVTAVPTALSKTCRDSITGRDAGIAALRAFLFQCGWYLAFYL